MPSKSQNRNSPPDSHDLFLGIDGGGTKTHAVIINSALKIVSEGKSGPSNPLRVGLETAVININEAITAACDPIFCVPGDIISATVGLAGVRRADLRESVYQGILRTLEIGYLRVTTDAEIAHYAATGGKAGLVIISGTGSICYGKDSDGNIATAGGWGPIAGDEGGGVSIAKQALQAIAKAIDGRGRQTRLSDVATDYFRAATPEDLIIAIYSPQMDNKRLAGFARCVIEAAKKGDPIAIEILSIAGFELGLAAYAVIRKLRLEKSKVPIGMVGSIFKAGGLLTDPLLETVRSFAPDAYLKTPKISPANAAAIMASDIKERSDKF